MKSLVFDDLTLKEVPVSIGGKGYVLREATEAAVCQWRALQTKAATFNQQTKQMTAGDISDSEPLLVSLCLFRTWEGGDSRQESMAVVKSWPSRVVGPLFEEAKRISGLSEVETASSLQEKIADLQQQLAELPQDSVGN